VEPITGAWCNKDLWSRQMWKQRVYPNRLWHGYGWRTDIRCFKWVLVLAACFLPSIPAHSEYRVQAGDVIEIFVARVPELQRRVTVQMDGSISFPLLGTMSVAGLSQAQLQVKVRSVLATKVFQQRLADGREAAAAMDPAEIIATIVEYRPIYVHGDVAKPGEYGYRPFMTARQAVAMSGGYDVVRARVGQIDVPELRSTHA